MKKLVLRMYGVRATPAAVSLGFAAGSMSEPKLDFVDRAFALGRKSMKQHCRTERRLAYHMGQVLRCATIVAGRAAALRGRAELLVEECRQCTEKYFLKAA